MNRFEGVEVILFEIRIFRLKIKISENVYKLL